MTAIEPMRYARATGPSTSLTRCRHRSEPPHDHSGYPILQREGEAWLPPRAGTPADSLRRPGSLHGTGSVRTSCATQATPAIFPAHSRAAFSPATSTTVESLYVHSLDSMNTYREQMSAARRIDQTLNPGQHVQVRRWKMKTPAAFISATNEP